jgi:GNAT superfamily N-acetyltransferase
MKKQTSMTVSELATQLRPDYFPLKIKTSVTCEIASKEEANSFIKKNYQNVFKRTGRSYFQMPPESREFKRAKPCFEEYKKIHGEHFLFKKNGRPIGWCYGEMEDFETFYMRNTGILPNYQSSGIYSAFLPHFLKYLKALGYQRVSSQHHPDNQKVLNGKLKQGFVIVGTENHERWGQLVKMVRFLDRKRDRFFKQKFL